MGVPSSENEADRADRVASNSESSSAGLLSSDAEMGIAAVKEAASSTASGMLGSAKSMLGIAPPKPPPQTVLEQVQEDMEGCFQMSYRQRMTGFAFCLVAGFLCVCLATMMIPFLVLRPAKFASESAATKRFPRVFLVL